MIVAVTDGISATTAFPQYHIGVVEEGMQGWEIGGVAGMLIQVFPTIFFGALFGKVLTDCSAAGSIANVMTTKLIVCRGQRKAGKACRSCYVVD